MKPQLGPIVGLAVSFFVGSAAFAEPQSTTPAPKPAKVTLNAVLDTDKSDVAESTAGSLLADAVRQAVSADIALIPANELVATGSVPPGSHAPVDIEGILRYRQDASDTIVVLNLTGKQLMEALERSVSREPQGFDGFLQVSGLQVRFDASKPIGQRIMEAGVPGAPISDTKHYTIATTHAAANGSFGYFRVWDKTAIVNDSGIPVVKALDDYTASHPTLSPLLDGRIKGL